MELSDGEFGRVSGRVESIYSIVIQMQRDIAVSIADQRRNDREISEIRASIAADAEKCDVRMTGVSSTVSSLKEDKRFFIGIVSGVALIIGAIQGIVIKAAYSYLEEVDHKFKEVEMRAKQHREQSLFDFSKHDAEIQTIKDKLRDGNLQRPPSPR